MTHFHPDHPTCPGCGASLTSSTLAETKVYDSPDYAQGKLFIHICASCRSAVGYFVEDQPKPDERYKVIEIRRDQQN